MKRSALLVGGVAVAASLASVAIAWAVLDAIPHVTDGIAYLFQARIFASGRLWLEAPPVPLSFSQANLLYHEGRWLSMYLPGWSALLAVGSVAGAPWVVNPVLLGLSVIAVWKLSRALFDDDVAGLLAAVLLATSPFALLMSAGLLSHTAALCLSLWCLVALANGVRRGGMQSWLAAGALGGLAVGVRPFTAFALLWPAVVWALLAVRRQGNADGGDEGDVLSQQALAGLALGVAPPLALLLAYQWAAFGGPLTTGYDVFAPGRSFTGGREAAQPLVSVLAVGVPYYVRELGDALWGWPWPDWLVLAPLLLPASHARGGRRGDLVLALCAGSLILGHGAYHHRDIVYGGPRLAFEALGPLSLLAARSLCLLGRSLGAFLSPGRQRTTAAVVAVMALLFSPLARRLPAQLELHGSWYHGSSAELLRAAERAGVGPEAIIFFSGSPFAYGPLLLENNVDVLAGRRVWVRDVPEESAALLALADREELWQLELDLFRLWGTNPYPDRFVARMLRYRRLRPAAEPEWLYRVAPPAEVPLRRR